MLKGEQELGEIVAVDINLSGNRSTLVSQNNWANINYEGGGVIGTGTESLPTFNAFELMSSEEELNWETHLNLIEQKQE